MRSFAPGLTFVLLLIAGCQERSATVAAGSGGDSLKASDSLKRAVPEQPVMQLSYEQRQGRFYFTRYCAVCHGEDGKGDGFNAFNLDPKPRNFTDARIMGGLSDDRLKETVREGGRGVNKSPLMPAWGGTLSAQQIEYVVAYVRTFVAQK